MDSYFYNKNGDWLLFAKSFLNIAELASKEIRIRDGRKYFNGTKLIYDEKLFIPIIFNIKHSIEIFLKTLNVTLTLDKLNKDNHGHNSLDLLKKTRKNFEKTKAKDIISVIRKAREKYPNDHYLTIAYEDINILASDTKLNDYFNKLEKLISKYQKCEFIKFENLKNITLNDHKNDAFRYPQNCLELKIDYNELINSINIGDNGIVDEILNDIKEIKKLFNFEFLLFIYNKYKKEF